MSVHDLPQEYGHTVFRTEGAPDPLPRAFAVVTACDPLGRSLGPEENRKADEALRAELESAGPSFFRVIGGSPDFDHAEPGFAIITAKSEALALARHFRQLAFWWIEGDRLWLVAADDGSSRELDGGFLLRVKENKPPGEPGGL